LNTNTLQKPRIETIDFLKGLAMVIMALDHVRDYFHFSAFLFDPADPTQSTLPIFLTRWITHFCAPAFSLLAGISAYMVGKRKTKRELSAYLLKRGIWLIFIEVTVIAFSWFFDIHFGAILLGVIWSLGVSMIFLAGLIYLPRLVILLFSLLLIVGHNLLDNIHFPTSMFWSMLHEFNMFKLGDRSQLLIGYPVIPWIAVMALGYYFGAFYEKTFDSTKRKKLFNWIGVTALLAFVVFRYTNLYGDAKPFVHYGTIAQDMISFLNPSKYPPSLLYLLMTLGAAFVFLANTEKLKGKIVNFFCTFGRVPFFYYILHLYLIHLVALVVAQFTGYGWEKMILPTWISYAPGLKGYGFSLPIVYIIWACLIFALYPICKKYDTYKQSHKEKWWLSYL
jgi:uncharacterized membrane protein